MALTIVALLLVTTTAAFATNRRDDSPKGLTEVGESCGGQRGLVFALMLVGSYVGRRWLHPGL